MMGDWFYDDDRGILCGRIKDLEAALAARDRAEGHAKTAIIAAHDLMTELDAASAAINREREAIVTLILEVDPVEKTFARYTTAEHSEVDWSATVKKIAEAIRKRN